MPVWKLLNKYPPQSCFLGALTPARHNRQRFCSTITLAILLNHYDRRFTAYSSLCLFMQRALISDHPQKHLKSKQEKEKFIKVMKFNTNEINI